MEKEEFKSEIQDQLGLAPGQECDAICSKMSEQEFREFIEYVKEALLRKKRRMMKELAPAVYAWPDRITNASVAIIKKLIPVFYLWSGILVNAASVFFHWF